MIKIKPTIYSKLKDIFGLKSVVTTPSEHSERVPNMWSTFSLLSVITKKTNDF